jgi:hypothetical protein
LGDSLEPSAAEIKLKFISSQFRSHPSDAQSHPVTDRLWEMSDVAEMLEAFEASRKQAA